MKHISLDRESESIQSFVRGLPVDADGSFLEIAGQPLLCVLPIRETVDPKQLKQAILRRRDESRETNADWDNADREVWNAGAH